MYLSICLSIFLIVILGVVIIESGVHQSKITNLRKKQDNINTRVKKYLENSNFQITKEFYLNDYATYNQPNNFKKTIAIDDDKKQVCFIDYEKDSLLIADFNEIINYEIYENGSNAITGANIGGICSGIFGAETNGLCKELKLIIRLKKYDTPQISYEIIDNSAFNIEMSKSSETYRKCISTLQEMVSFLEILKNENNLQ